MRTGAGGKSLARLPSSGPVGHLLPGGEKPARRVLFPVGGAPSRRQGRSIRPEVGPPTGNRPARRRRHAHRGWREEPGQASLIRPAGHLLPGGEKPARRLLLLWEARPRGDRAEAFTPRSGLPQEIARLAERAMRTGAGGKSWPGFPHPALWATFSRGEKGKALPAVGAVLTTKPFSTGRLGGCARRATCHPMPWRRVPPVRTGRRGRGSGH